MTQPIRLKAALNKSLRDAITEAIQVMDRCQKNFMAANVEGQYVFDYHGIEVPVDPKTTSFPAIRESVAEIMRQRELAHATAMPSGETRIILISPPHNTGTSEDLIWSHNTLLLIANHLWEREPLKHQRYGVNVNVRAREVNPWELDWQKTL